MSLAEVHNTRQLQRWLHTRVGRPWDDVWSEITTSKPRSEYDKGYRGFDMIRHIRWLVYENTFQDSDGKRMKQRRGLSGFTLILPGEFYVDGQGRLQEVLDRPEPRAPTRPSRIVQVDGRTFARHDNGLWYECWLETPPVSPTAFVTPTRFATNKPQSSAKAKPKPFIEGLPRTLEAKLRLGDCKDPLEMKLRSETLGKILAWRAVSKREKRRYGLQ